MKLSEVKIQIKALDSYLSHFIQKLDSLDNTSEKDEDGDDTNSERTNYFIYSYWIDESVAEKNATDREINEGKKVLRRYLKIRKELVELFPDYFSDLVHPDPDELSVRILDELSRELINIKEIIEGIESENQPPAFEDFFPFGKTSPNNDPFSEAEQKDVAGKLNLIEAELVNAAIQNAEFDEDLKESLDTNINEIKNEIQELKSSSAKMGRKDWLGQFYSVYFNLVMCICFSNEARTTLFTAIQGLSTFIQTSALHLLNK